MRAEDINRREKEIAEREKEYNEKVNGVIGAVVKALSPYLPAINGALDQRRMVAGVDTDEPVHAAPIIPDAEQEQPEEQEQSPFTEAEEEEAFALIARFKEIEPENWLKMLRKMVSMAEANDTYYGVARNVLTA